MPELEEVVVRPAASEDELDATFRLRYEAYLQQGYVSPNQSGMMRDKWDDLPRTIHFVAVKEDEVIGAVRLVLDSEEGLPMERVFAEEIGALRSQSRNIAEASALVVAKEHRVPGTEAYLFLCREVWQQARDGAVDDLCIAVIAKHRGFYRRILFESIGSGKHYQSLNGVFAHPMRLRIRELQSAQAAPTRTPLLPLHEILL